MTQIDPYVAPPVVTNQAWRTKTAEAITGEEPRTAARAVIGTGHNARGSVAQTLGQAARTGAPGSFGAAMALQTDGGRDAGSDFSFGDVLDMINPLQHIPLLSNLYRAITGDEIGPVARIVGGTIYGGPVGAVASTANVVVEARTGRDIAGNMVSLVTGAPEEEQITDVPTYSWNDPQARLDSAARRLGVYAQMSAAEEVSVQTRGSSFKSSSYNLNS